MKKIITLLGLLCSTLAMAQKTDTITVGTPFERYAQMEFGTYQMVTYTKMNGKTFFPSLKTITTKEINLSGKTYLSVKHLWVSGDSKMDGTFEYLCEPETLRPVQHIRKTTKKGIEAFSFLPEKVISLDTVKENALAGFNVPLEVPTYNWEIDIETYSLLPMKEGYKVVMNFYHPGGSPPGYCLLEVEGSEVLSLPGRSQMDCWVLYTDYGGRQPTRFWYTKNTQQFIKMEGAFHQMEIYKYRLMH
ncbi:MAG: hypothetical protein HRU12_11560 [Phaeodactylibacter sp.]|nr:hypothetical protein [Phaeodactylibacter sp.]